MDWDDRPRPKPEVRIGEDLTTFSVEDLTVRIAALKSEILRVEEELARKAARKSAADALFSLGPRDGLTEND